MSFFPDRFLNAPGRDELEITVFGPGYGESIVLHVPQVGWGVIDCCVFKKDSKTINLPLEYLKNLRPESAEELAFVILTHPHQDHYQGMDQLLRRFKGKIRRVCWYAGDGIRELKQYICLQKVAGNEVLQGFAEVYRSMNDAAKSGAVLRRLGELTPVFDSSAARLIALSPSAASTRKYVEKLFSAVPEEGKAVQPMKDDDHNLISIALLLQFNRVQVVLGSDLEADPSPARGWNAVVYNEDCPDLWASMVKVAHHGSLNAYSEEAWKCHCSFSSPIAVITPFFHAGTALPEEKIMDILKDKTSDLFLTGAGPKYGKVRNHYRRDLERALRSHTRSFRVLEPSTGAGFVRVRFKADGEIAEKIAIPPSGLISTFHKFENNT